MKKFILVLALWSTGADAYAAAKLSGTTALSLQVGEQAVLETNGSVSVTASNPKALKVFLSGKNIQLVGKQAGMAEVLILPKKKKITVTVYSLKVGEVRIRLLRWIKKIYGVQLETKPEKIYLHGLILRKQDWMDLQRFKEQFGTLLVSDVAPSPMVWTQIESAVRDDFKRKSISPAHVHARDGRVEILVSPQEKDKDTTDQLAKKYGLSEELGGNAVDLKPMIEIEVVIAEVKKNSMQSLGLKPPQFYSATVLPAPDFSSTAVTFNPATPELHAYFSQDMGRVLANPKLLCRSGEAAHFVAGGEIPIKIISWKNSDVIWKRYGVILDIMPVADLAGGISTKISTEISLLDEAHKVEGIPGLLTNRIDTHFDLQGNKTIALSGLIKSESGRNSVGIPGLAAIPILGELFKSRDYQENKTELVIFVTPRMISPDNPPPPPDRSTWSSLWDDNQ